MDIKRLKYFSLVVEYGSISAAAKKIPVSQPALTRQIMILEETVGARLLERTRSGVLPTSAGHFLYEKSQHLLAEINEISKKTRDISNGYIEFFTLGITPIHSYIPHVSHIIKSFRSCYPKTKLSLDSMLSGPQIIAIKDGDIDAGVVFMDHDVEPGIEYQLLSTFRMAVIFSRRHCLWETDPTSLSEFSNIPFIRFSRNSTPRSYDRIDRCFRAAGVTPNTIQECHDDITIRSLVAAGMGYAIMPGIMAVGNDQLQALELDDLMISSQLMLAWRQGRKSKAVESLSGIATSMAKINPSVRHP